MVHNGNGIRFVSFPQWIGCFWRFGQKSRFGVDIPDLGRIMAYGLY